MYLPFAKFSISSLLSAFLDYLLLALIHIFSSSLLLSVMGARLTSSLFNFSMNKKYLFSKGKRSTLQSSMLKYFTLVILIFVLNYGLMYAFYDKIGVPLLLAKLLTEASLFLFSYWSQLKFVY
ncbi:MAG: GtrA family protein [Bacillota bacterium]